MAGRGTRDTLKPILSTVAWQLTSHASVKCVISVKPVSNLVPNANELMLVEAPLEPTISNFPMAAQFLTPDGSSTSMLNSQC